MIKKRYSLDNRGMSSDITYVGLAVITCLIILIVARSGMWRTLLEMDRISLLKEVAVSVPAAFAILAGATGIMKWASKREYKKFLEAQTKCRNEYKNFFEGKTKHLSNVQKALLWNRAREKGRHHFYDYTMLQEFCEKSKIEMTQEQLQGLLEHPGQDTAPDWELESREYFRQRFEEIVAATTTMLDDERRDALRQTIEKEEGLRRYSRSYVSYVWEYCKQQGLPVGKEEVEKMVLLYIQSQGYAGYIGVL